MSKHPRQPNVSPANIKHAASARLAARVPARPPIIHTLADDPDDPEQNNLVSADQQINGLPVTIPIWLNASPFPTDFDEIEWYIDENRVGSVELPGPITGDQNIVVNSARLRTHGHKAFTYSIRLNGAPDVATSDPILVFVDTLDPNNESIPDALLLPAGLPPNGVTMDYLVANGGLTLTLPRPLDSRSGDTYRVFYGQGDSAGKTGSVPLTGDIEVTYSIAEVVGFGEDTFLLNYQFIDRARNDTALSIGRSLTVSLAAPPVLGAPQITGAPLVDKEEAREGVLVEVPTITGHLPDDWLVISWEGRRIYFERLGVNPTVPVEIIVKYEDIALPGDSYNAAVSCWIERKSVPFPQVTTTVNVDLVEPGTPLPGPGPIDPRLFLPLIRGDSGVDNKLIKIDLAGDIDVTFLMFTDHAAGDFIDLYYGRGLGDFADTYTVLATDTDTTVVSLKIDPALIEKHGNGDVPCWYRVRNAVNYKQSRAQAVEVDIFVLDNLADPIFTELFGGRIRCIHSPWLGVPIKVFDPTTLKDGDVVRLTALRYLYDGTGSPPATPVAGSQVISDPIDIGPDEVANGFTHNFMLPYFDSTKTTGWVEVRWTLNRALPSPVNGTSDAVAVVWDIRSGSETGTCAPTVLRGSLV